MAWGQGLEWTTQFGTPEADASWAVATQGALYVTGVTSGTLPGQTKTSGTVDAFLRKYDSDGHALWTRQFGSPDGASASGIAAAPEGVYVVGTLIGQSSGGNIDALLAKYDADGGLIWTRLFGTSGPDDARAIALDGSSVYVVGATSLPDQATVGFDAYLSKFSTNGTEAWTRYFGSSSDDFAEGIATDGSGLYVVGRTGGLLPDQNSAGGVADAFIRKYDSDGNLLWTRQFGSRGYDDARGVAVDWSGVYVVGSAEAALPGQVRLGTTSAFIRKYDAEGNEVWTQQFGSRLGAEAWAVAADDAGVYVVGETHSALEGQGHRGGADIFVRKYDAGGTELWTQQLGSPGNDRALGIALSATTIYIVGSTTDAFPGHTSAGDSDAFVVSLQGHTEARPSTAVTVTTTLTEVMIITRAPVTETSTITVSSGPSSMVPVEALYVVASVIVSVGGWIGYLRRRHRPNSTAPSPR